MRFSIGSLIGASMTVQKSVDLRGEGSTVEAAVEEALDRATVTLEGITGFDVRRVKGRVENDGPRYVVEIRVWFTLLERFHE
jgi:flavin-binding protein dodecin